jgi:hypothetical protein
MEGGGADEWRVDREARPAPDDEVGLERTGEQRRERAAEEQKSERLGAIRLEPPDARAGREVDRRADQQQRVHEQRRGARRPGGGLGAKRQCEARAVAAFEQIGVGHAGANPLDAAAHHLEVGLAVHLEDAVARLDSLAHEARREIRDHRRAADARVGERVGELVRRPSHRAEREHEREQGPADEQCGDGAAHQKGGGRGHRTPGTRGKARGARRELSKRVSAK